MSAKIDRERQKGRNREKVSVQCSRHGQSVSQTDDESLGITSDKRRVDVDADAPRVLETLIHSASFGRVTDPNPCLPSSCFFQCPILRRSLFSSLETLVTMTSHTDYKWISETLNRPTISCTPLAHRHAAVPLIRDPRC